MEILVLSHQIEGDGSNRVWNGKEMPVIHFHRECAVSATRWRKSPSDFCWGEALPAKCKYVKVPVLYGLLTFFLCLPRIHWLSLGSPRKQENDNEWFGG